MSLDLLDRLARRGVIRAVDLHFARQIAGYATQSADAMALAAALASIALGRGDVCVDLAAPDARDAPLGVDPAALRAALLAEPGVCAVAPDETPRPLVLDGERLYLRRYWQAECRVATRLRDMAARILPLEPSAVALLPRLFDTSVGGTGQRLACELAAARSLAVITGGPGTGKTTTVARLLLMLATQARARGERPVMQLAAPTGKAAARVSEALGRELAALEISGLLDADTAALLPRTAQTLHRLLGAGSDGRFRHDRDNPLPADVVVLDESSMVDLRLLDALLAALPPTARLVLLGDREQLAAVEAGNVFGALCTVPDDAPSAIAGSIAVLRHSYRFGGVSGIGRLAAAVNGADVVALEALLDGKAREVACQRYATRLASPHHAWLRERFRPLVEAARGSAEPARVLALLDAFRVLTPLREGDFGVAGLNAAIERALSDAGLRDAADPFYPGRPILVTRNDHGLRLYNGDVGVVVRDGEGRPRALFAQGTEVRALPVSRLPEHDTAYAMTVHKSQGSEFDAVMLVLPPLDDDHAAVGGRELVYTAITRARSEITLLLPEGPFDTRWLRRGETHSGLAERLHTLNAENPPSA